MYESLGLARDPFLPHFDEKLHVTDDGVRRLLKTSLNAVKAGRSLWVRGPSGSGRESFVTSLAERLAADRPVAMPFATVREDGRTLLASLYSSLCVEPPPAETLGLCEAVYSRLAEVFWTASPVLCIAKADAMTPVDLEELGIIAELSFMGKAVVTVIACGEGEPPLPGMEVVELGAPTSAQLAHMLTARLALCGGAGLFDAQVDQLLKNASGYSDALRLGSEALARARFSLATATEREPEQLSAPGLFPAETLDEVGRLLEEISVDNSG